MTTHKEREANALKYLNKLRRDGPRPAPAEEIIVTKLPDFIGMDGRKHSMVDAKWNAPRMLTHTDIMLFGYFSENKIHMDKDSPALCWGFTGREVEYKDYCQMHGFKYETK